MSTASNVTTKPTWQIWVGRVFTALPALAFALSAAMKLSHNAEFLENWTKLGFAESQATPVGIVELACVVVYLIPRTAVLGAILLTGYLGGATVTHLRVGQPVFLPVFLGVIVWGGIYLREDRLRDLIPLRKP